MEKLPEEDDALWRVLGKARRVQPSPFFARNVLRVIRPRSESRGWLRWWKPSLATAGALIAITLTSASLMHHSQQNALARQVTDERDYAVIAQLDELLASENNSVWLENPVD